jgi:hypothetical protein
MDERMARLMHLWYLKRQGYSSTLFIPFSSYVERSGKAYYKAYKRIENNEEISQGEPYEVSLYFVGVRVKCVVMEKAQKFVARVGPVHFGWRLGYTHSRRTRCAFPPGNVLPILL